MSNNREKDLWKELRKRDVLLALLVMAMLIGAYPFFAKPNEKTFWSVYAYNTLAADVIANVIPVFLVYILSYTLLHRIQALWSERETGELASKVADRVKSELTLKASHQVDMPEGQLIIKAAKYGATVKNIDYYNDVTNVVRSAIVAGRVEIPVNNDHFGPDPIKREPKAVTVDYVYAGRDGYSKTVPEKAKLLLP